MDKGYIYSICPFCGNFYRIDCVACGYPDFEVMFKNYFKGSVLANGKM